VETDGGVPTGVDYNERRDHQFG